MGAIAGFISELRRQRDLLEFATHRDSFAEALLDGHGHRAPENRRRIWTRRDRRRIDTFRAWEEMSPEEREAAHELPSLDSGNEPLFWTRVDRVVRRFLPPLGPSCSWHYDDEGRRSIGRFLKSAIAEARSVGTTDLPELFLRMMNAHYDLIRYFWETKEDQHAEAFNGWGNVDNEWNELLEKVERLSPQEPVARAHSQTPIPTVNVVEAGPIDKQFETLRDAIHSSVFWLCQVTKQAPGSFPWSECCDGIERDIAPARKLNLPAIDEIVRPTTETPPRAWVMETLAQLARAQRLVGSCQNRESVTAVHAEMVSLVRALEEKELFLLHLPLATGGVMESTSESTIDARFHYASRPWWTHTGRSDDTARTIDEIKLLIEYLIQKSENAEESPAGGTTLSYAWWKGDVASDWDRVRKSVIGLRLSAECTVSTLTPRTPEDAKERLFQILQAIQRTEVRQQMNDAHPVATAVVAAAAASTRVDKKFPSDPIWRILRHALNVLNGLANDSARATFIRTKDVRWDGFFDADKLNRLAIEAGLCSQDNPILEVFSEKYPCRTTLLTSDGSRLKWNILEVLGPQSIVDTIEWWLERRAAQLTTVPHAANGDSPASQESSTKAWSPEVPPTPQAIAEMADPDRATAKEAWVALNVLYQAILAWDEWLADAHRKFSHHPIDGFRGDSIVRRGRTAFVALEKLGFELFTPMADGTGIADDWPQMDLTDPITLDRYADPANYGRESKLAMKRFRLRWATITNVQEMLDEVGQHPGITLGKVRPITTGRGLDVPAATTGSRAELPTPEQSAAAESTPLELSQAMRGAAAEPEFPPDDGWHFEPGAFFFRKVRYDLVGLPLEIIKQFSISRPGRRLGYSDLGPALDSSGLISEASIRVHVGAARQALRGVCGKLRLDIPDPLLHIKTVGWEFRMPRK